jgi:hypothetical protein
LPARPNALKDNTEQHGIQQKTDEPLDTWILIGSPPQREAGPPQEQRYDGNKAAPHEGNYSYPHLVNRPYNKRSEKEQPHNQNRRVRRPAIDQGREDDEASEKKNRS